MIKDQSVYNIYDEEVITHRILVLKSCLRLLLLNYT